MGELNSNIKKIESINFGDEIVISGISGRFPKCDNVRELHEKLLNKVDLMTEINKTEYPNSPKRYGKINNVTKFDHLFFGVQHTQANSMNAASRILLESTFEAIIDAGYNPKSLKNTNVGVFIGVCNSGLEGSNKNDDEPPSKGASILGTASALIANRISYWLNVHGPSYVIDTACSSSLLALEHAYQAIRSGKCNAAIVGGATLIDMNTTMQFSQIGVLSPDGYCKCFDEDADGYARSEGIAVAFVQKAKDANRLYTRLVHIKTNCDGFKEEGITFPSTKMQIELLQQVYDECGIPPTSLSYVEAHCTATTVGDPEECNTIDKALCTGRSTPLKVGSVKSNLGHTEPVSGIISLIKVIIGMECGLIPPNMHLNKLNPNIPALIEKRIQIITEPTPWDGGFVGINNFGFGGVNVHALFQSNLKEKVNGGAAKDNLPRLVVASARTEEAVKTILNDVEENGTDAEYIALFHNIFSDNIPKHSYRGYTIVRGVNSSTNFIPEIQQFMDKARPICFVYSGMGSQYNEMGRALLNFPVFAKAIEKCDRVLKIRGVNIYDILTTKDTTIFNNILNSFVGIAAVQVGLTDILFHIGVKPDIIIGHSVGELGCAYADGALTAEQMILAAWARGKASNETALIHGLMASIGMTADDLKKILPEDIDIACYNSADNCTISGPHELVQTFVKKLQADNIFAREVNTGQIAYHSRYIANAGPKLYQYLKEIIPNKTKRSSKWISSSVPQSQWDSPEALMNSPEYHKNNLLNPVLFHHVTKLLPEDVITLEIAPHSLLRPILKKSLHKNAINVALTDRKQKNHIEIFLKAIGQLYNSGVQPKLANLYPPVHFPVSRGTLMISPLIKWDHSNDWNAPNSRSKSKSCEREITISLENDDYKYLAGHVVGGRILLPATGFLFFVWQSFSLMKNSSHTDTPVIFQDVKLLSAINIPEKGAKKINIIIQKGSGFFEVIEGETVAMSGIIRLMNSSKEKVDLKDILQSTDDEEITTNDFYKECRIRGYEYSGVFKGIKSANIKCSVGHVKWFDNWVGFMDSVLQILILKNPVRRLFVPIGFEKIVVDPREHLKHVHSSNDKDIIFSVHVIHDLNALISGGLEIHGLRFNVISIKRSSGKPLLEEYKFVDHRDVAHITLREAVCLSLHIALENNLNIKITTLEYIHENKDDLLSPMIVELTASLPLLSIDVNIIVENKNDNVFDENINVLDFDSVNSKNNVMICYGKLLLTKQNENVLKKLIDALQDGGFLMTRESTQSEELYNNAESFGLQIVMEKAVGNEFFMLFRKKEPVKKSIIIKVDNFKFDWLTDLKIALKKESNGIDDETANILIVAQDDSESGILGLVNCLVKEPGGKCVRGFLIQDPKAPKFSIDNPFYAEQIKLNLILNVLKPGGVWGTYRHLPLPKLELRSVHHVVVNQKIKGSLSSIEWAEGPIRIHDNKSSYLIYVVYASLNFRNVMLFTGKLLEQFSGSNYLCDISNCFEYCGIDSNGRKVMGVTNIHAISNIIKLNVSSEMFWNIPEDWSFEEAATVPVAYSTCYYALYIKGNMKKGEKILIHCGSGAVGQAAIHLALFEGCEVFTTVGTEEKRQFIRNNFPEIPETHIGNSRDTSFEKLVMRQTHGKGVDIVLNSLIEDKLQASVRCLAENGRFLEIGKFDIAVNNYLGLKYFEKGITFYGIDLLSVDKSTNLRLVNLLFNGIKKGAVKPLTRNIFQREELEIALRHMAAGKHIGKVIIKMRNENDPLNVPVMASPKYNCLQNRSYLITGGLGGFGLELADWLVLQGARNLVLTSRSGIQNGYQMYRLELWKSCGVKVTIVVGKDASKKEECKEIMEAAIELAPIDGIFHLAMVLKDNLLENQTEESFEETLRCKAWSAKVLDVLSRELCPDLRHFVVFSSVTCGRGNPGQTNYAMSNSIMERICEKRMADGFPGLAVQWGPIGDVGIVAEKFGKNKQIMGGLVQQKISSCLEILDKFLQSNCTIVSSMVIAVKKSRNVDKNDIMSSVLSIMEIKDLQSVGKHVTLVELGMDSMMAVEIKQTLENDHEIFLNINDLRTLTFAKLEEMDNKWKSKTENSSNSSDVIGDMKILFQSLYSKTVNINFEIKMPTIFKDETQQICLIPGIDAIDSIFSNILPKLTSPSLCLQFDLDKMQDSTIEKVAEIYFKHLLKEYEGKRFVIVGYSYGALIAIELARRIEDHGLLNRLILIDGSIDLCNILHKQSQSFDDIELQNVILIKVLDLFDSVMGVKLYQMLIKCNTWEEKLETFLAEVYEKYLKMLEREEVIKVLKTLYARFLMLRKYDFNKFLSPFNSPVSLIRPTKMVIKSISEDYGLQKITSNRLEIHYIDGSHVTIMDSDEVAAIINNESTKNEISAKSINFK